MALGRSRGSRIGSSLLLCVLVVVLGNSMVSIRDTFNPEFHAKLHRWFPNRYPDEISGTMAAGGSVGTWTMQTSVCHSGEPEGYFGVTFFDPAQPELGGKIVIPPVGDGVMSVNLPGQGGSDEVKQSDCQVWDVDVQRAGERDNGIWALRGHVKVECRFHQPEGRVAADMVLRRCH